MWILSHSSQQPTASQLQCPASHRTTNTTAAAAAPTFTSLTGTWDTSRHSTGHEHQVRNMEIVIIFIIDILGETLDIIIQHVVCAGACVCGSIFIPCIQETRCKAEGQQHNSHRTQRNYSTTSGHGAARAWAAAPCHWKPAALARSSAAARGGARRKEAEVEEWRRRRKRHCLGFHVSLTQLDQLSNVFICLIN